MPTDSTIDIAIRKDLMLKNSLITIIITALFSIYFMITGSQIGVYLSVGAFMISVFIYISSVKFYDREALHISILLYLAIMVISQFFIQNAFTVICFIGISLTSALFMFSNSKVKLFYYFITLVAGIIFINQYFVGIEISQELLIINCILFSSFLTFELLFHNHITKEQNQYLNEIKKSRDFLQNIIDSIPQLIYIKGLDGKYKMVNHSAAKYHDIPKEAFEGKTVFDVVSDTELIKDIIEQDKEVKSSGKAIRIRRELIPVNEVQKRYFETEKTPIFDHNGDMHYILSVSTDVTERVNTLEELKSSKNMYKLLFDHAYEDITFLDIEKMEILESNKKFFPEVDQEEFIGGHALTFSANTQPDGTPSNEKLLDLMDQVRKHKRAEVIWRLQRESGEEFLIEANLSLLPPPNDHIAIAVSRDITEKSKAQEVERNLEKKSIELEALNHELNTYNLFVANKNSLLKTIMDDLSSMNSNGFPAEEKRQLQSIVRRIENNLENKQEWLEFKTQFQRIYPNFFKYLTVTYPKLTENDLKHCAYMKMKLSLGEVADLMFVDKKAVEVARYRIKKKMNLQKVQKLKDEISAIGG